MNQKVNPAIPIKDPYEHKLIESCLKIIEFYSKEKKLNISKLAQEIGVSRAWIYKYFGSDTENILKTAIEMLGPILTGARRGSEVWKTNSVDGWIENILVTFEITIEQVRLYPTIFRFYLQERLQNSEIGTHLRLQEDRYVSEVVCFQLESLMQGSTFAQRLAVSNLLFALKIGMLFRWLTIPENELTNEVQKTREAISLLIKNTI